MFNWCCHIGLLPRSVWAFFTALVIVICLGKTFIRILQKSQMKQIVRDNGPESHLKKSGTPTMGGILILLAITISALLWAQLNNVYVWTALLSMLAIGALGWWDDWKKVVLKNSKGVSGKFKMAWQTIVALIAGFAIYHFHHNGGAMWIPIAHHVWLLSWGFVIFAWFVIVGASNSVNLTDGLDGLVTLPVMLVAVGLGLLIHFGHHGQVGSSEMLVLSGATLGAGLGFLWFNGYPAQLFMGDVGALALGTLLAVMALIIGQVWAFAIMSGLFIIEALSVMLQVGSYKLRNKKRIFKMAPIHHHFELSGLFETKVTTRFWIVSVVLLVIGLLVGLA